MKKSFLIIIIAIVATTANAQLIITADTNTLTLVNNFILSGVTASNVQYTGAGNTLGSFSNGNSTDIGLNDGIIMTTGNFTSIPIGSPSSNFASYDNMFPGDTDLANTISLASTFDACVLEFDLVPAGNVLEFQYVFASEEYPEYVNSGFNDVFGFFITGINPAGGNYTDSNIAIIPGTALPVAINNVNNGSNSPCPTGPCMNCTYYVDNCNGQKIVYDGFTTVLYVHSYVIPSTTYHLKMAIADVSDAIYDSGIFLKAQSMKSYNETASVSDHPSSLISVFPNPADDKITITLKGNSQVEIMNIAGQVLQSINADNSISVDISTLPEGLYFARILNADKITVIKFRKE